MPETTETQFKCPNCGFVGSLEHFDVCGADDGKMFCTQCSLEDEMIELDENGNQVP
jgi:predicted RNA-binding Zn-ribbon protein involved in translation (DUF1610 family)